MTENVTRGEKLGTLWRVVRYEPLLAVAIVALSLFGAVVEGVGVGYLLPIVERANQGAIAADGGGRVLDAFRTVYDALGVPLTLETLVAGVGLVMSVRYVVSFAVAWLQAVLGTSYVRDLMREVYYGCLDAQVRELDRRGSDDLLNAIITETAYPQQTVLSLTRFVEQSLLCLIYAAIAFYLAPLLLVGAAVVLGGAAVTFRRAVRPAYETGEQVADANEDIQRVVRAGVQGRRDVRLFSLRDRMADAFDHAADAYVEGSVALQREKSLLHNAYQLLSTVVILGFVYASVALTSLSIGGLAVFLFAMFRLAPRINTLNGLFYSIDGQLPHLVRLYRLVDGLDDADRGTGGETPVLDRIDTLIAEDVTFAYEDEPVLDSLSVEMSRPGIVALVGESGAGKSTFAALLARLYEPDAGEIRADGTPISAFDLREWREQVAMVQQDPYVFDHTLRFNLALGDPGATDDDDLDRVCEIAGVTEFLDDLPDGYDTPLGDDGVRLSGGQRQRVALARALLTDADVLVLDEATSNLDAALEARVHDAIAATYPDRLIVVVAHRLSTVTVADHIYVMKDGTVVSAGTHRSLIDEDGTYADLVESQLD